MLKLLKVSGDSLSPKYQDGDFVLIAKIPVLFNRLKPGDVIVFCHDYFGSMIKEVDAISEDGESLFVLGTHENSIDSIELGPIHKTAVEGRVIWHIRRPLHSS